MADTPSPSPSTEPPGPSARRTGPSAARKRSLLLIGLGGALAVLIATALAATLNDPVGAGARDPMANMPTVIGSPGAGAGNQQPSLPPLTLMTNLQLPAELNGLSGAALIERLRERAAGQRSARRLVELGSALQVQGRSAEAIDAFRAALRVDPDDLAARIGLALAPAAGGDRAAMERANKQLTALEQRFPGDQLPVFNRAWLAVYRTDADTANQGFSRTVALNPTSPLGTLAQSLLNATTTGEPAQQP